MAGITRIRGNLRTLRNGWLSYHRTNLQGLRKTNQFAKKLPKPYCKIKRVQYRVVGAKSSSSVNVFSELYTCFHQNSSEKNDWDNFVVLNRFWFTYKTKNVSLNEMKLSRLTEQTHVINIFKFY